MLYYIKHEIIGDLVQHINDGVHVRSVNIIFCLMSFFNRFIAKHRALTLCLHSAYTVACAMYLFTLGLVSV
jgi:hypothetical protein